MRDLLRKAWIPLALVVVVAGLTALSGELAARNDGQEGEATAGQDQEQRVGGRGGQRGGGRSTAAAPGIPRDWNWWKDEAVKQELGLTDEKAALIEQIYQARVSRMRPYADEFVRESRVFDQMTRERVAAAAAYEIQASKLEFLRAQLNTSRWVMLYRIYRELEPEQYQKLLEIRDQRFSRGRGGPPR